MYEPGEPITFGEGARDVRSETELLEARAIEPITDGAPIASSAPPPPFPAAPSSPPASAEKPLAKMNKAELLAAAAAAGVEATTPDGKPVVLADLTNKQIAAAIEAKRAEVSE
ncbi:MAG TPA: hypothetical protein VFT56_01065 [Sphingomonas sp.]|nr:hypothetical protein [Sphingomonas sp.]